MWLVLTKSFSPLTNADFTLVSGNAGNLYVDANDFPGLKHAVDNLKSDINLVSGITPEIKNTYNGHSANTVFIGSIGKSAIIDNLISKGIIDVSPIKGKWE
jgi:hypothetical protein